METTTQVVEKPQAVQTQNQAPSRENLFSGPFDLIAYLLMQLRMKLEEKDTFGNPTYIRILNINNEEQHLKPISDAVEKSVEYFSFFVSKLHHLTLQAQEILNQVDSFKSIYGVQIRLTTEFLEYTDVISKFFKMIAGKNDPGNEVGNFVSDAYIDGLKDMEEFLETIPSPEDLGRIGEEIYRLIAIVHKMQGEHRLPDVNQTGKIRMVYWSFDWKEDNLCWPLEYPNDKSSKVVRFGKNSLLNAATRDGGTFNHYYEDPQFNKKVKLYTFDKDTDKDQDLKEAVELLKALGYVAANTTVSKTFEVEIAGLKKALMSFQYNNELPVTGLIDNDTMNRLLNLDFEGRNIKRAKAGEPAEFDIENTYGGTLGLTNPDADGYQDEGITLETQKGAYDYYQIGSGTTNKWKGVKASEEVAAHWSHIKFIPGFVALESRKIESKRTNDAEPLYDGGKWSEGQAAGGRFFFAARHTEPWVPGRDGSPGKEALHDPQQTLAEAKKNHSRISRMYQDIEVNKDSEAFVNFVNLKDTYNIAFQASCMRRSIYNEKTNKLLPDQGKIGLEVYKKGTGGKLTLIGQDKVINVTNKGWLPNSFVTGLKTDREVDQKSFWFLQKSQQTVCSIDAASENESRIKIDPTTGTFVFRVILDGLFNGGWDIDAYFDDVKIRWDLQKK